MEILIVICLIIVIVLLLKDKVVIQRAAGRKGKTKNERPDLPDIMGLPKPLERHPLPMDAAKSQREASDDISDNFETETYETGFARKIPQEELDEVFGSTPDFRG